MKTKKILCIVISLITLISIVSINSFASDNSKCQTILDYAVANMKLNKAAACGILANIEYESDFNPTLVGDNGTSYGICQWHGERWTNLKSYCNKNGYDWHTLNGQLHFLQYELENNPSDTGYILSKLKNVPNSSSGAYTAAYDWCYYFERPANKEYNANKRGDRAYYYWNNFNPTNETPTKPDVTTNWTGVINADPCLRIRKNPDINSEILATIPNETVINVIAENNGWGKVKYNNVTGYISLEYVKKIENKPVIKTGDINQDNVINSDDALLILNYVIGTQSLNAENLKIADINKDGIVNSTDALNILEVAIR